MFSFCITCLFCNLVAVWFGLNPAFAPFRWFAVKIIPKLTYNVLNGTLYLLYHTIVGSLLYNYIGEIVHTIVYVQLCMCQPAVSFGTHVKAGKVMAGHGRGVVFCSSLWVKTCCRFKTMKHRQVLLPYIAELWDSEADWVLLTLSCLTYCTFFVKITPYNLTSSQVIEFSEWVKSFVLIVSFDVELFKKDHAL